jgi:integrase
VKTANSVRTIPTYSSVLDELAAHLAEHGPSQTGALVLHQGGRYVTATQFETAWRTTRAAADVPSRFRFHDLRHHVASEMLGEGLSVVAVAAVLGDTPTTVLRHYGHFVRNDDDRVRATMRRLRAIEDSLRTAHPGEGS